jgi:RNA:NAD 2'-phosphotransferase (TPT1/KptA family)
MHRQGFKFFLADNGVWLIINQVPPEFLIVVQTPAQD